ncbi:MAG: hypothetical protein COT15_04980 [Candidatus Diapherotrites archaeon CG08_land_8_20_14_0_20_34_12]|nr:MAG: hypothetical protein COT15_04980 [Candidatus Diapherotrites archaeon CG08_land_8_20_14_0_20_34_12]
MNKVELVYRELLFQALEKNNFLLTQKELSNLLSMSLSTVNLSLKPLRRMNAIKVNPMNLKTINPRKVLLYWASVRNLNKDIAYQTRVDVSISEIEKNIPANCIFGAYSAYKFRFKEVPADYSEVYVYADSLDEIKKRFPSKSGQPNLFVILKDVNMGRYGKITSLAQTFVDIWNLGEWYSSDFIKALEMRINGILE